MSFKTDMDGERERDQDTPVAVADRKFDELLARDPLKALVVGFLLALGVVRVMPPDPEP